MVDIRPDWLPPVPTGEIPFNHRVLLEVDEQSTIDQQRRARYIARTVRREKHDAIRNVFRAA
jgi:hypothetical protein